MKNDEVKIGALLKLFSGQEKIKTKLTQKRLEQAWRELYKDLQIYTRKLRYHDGQLTVELDSAVLRNELNYNIQLIISQLNEYIGEDVVKTLVLR
ncbi:MAG: DUF721 domain-containing protein [Saprospiraceae bacterium]|nr:DUF721 domain-containing protein [Saprospiraceae bacterium]